MSNIQKIKLTEDQQISVALHHMSRADDSANQLRSLLFGLCVLSVGFLVADEASQNRFTLLALAFLTIALGLLVWSWNLQKEKAIRRRNKAISHGKLIHQPKMIRNQTVDAFAFGLIAIGFVSGILGRVALCGGSS